MPDISLRDLLDAGVHFGHQTRRWNPRMKPYIFGQKNGIHIINLQQTAIQLARACAFVTEAVAKGEKILFVGTKRQASDIVAESARAAGQYHVTHRWLGGMLTNFKTVKGSIDRLNKLERDRDEGRWELVNKKERIGNERKTAKLKASLGGIQEMTSLPGVIFIIDPKKEGIAVQEAKRLGITLVAVCDTNCDPEKIDFVIPGNDDALKAIKLFAKAISDAAIEGSQLAKDYARREYSHMGGQAFTGEADAGPEVLMKPGSELDSDVPEQVEAEPAAEEAPVTQEAPVAQEAAPAADEIEEAPAPAPEAAEEAPAAPAE